MDKIDQQYLNEIVGGTEPGEVDTQHDLKVHEENTTIEELEVYYNCTTSVKKTWSRLWKSFLSVFYDYLLMFNSLDII